MPSTKKPKAAMSQKAVDELNARYAKEKAQKADQAKTDDVSGPIVDALSARGTLPSRLSSATVPARLGTFDEPIIDVLNGSLK